MEIFSFKFEGISKPETMNDFESIRAETEDIVDFEFGQSATEIVGVVSAFDAVVVITKENKNRFRTSVKYDDGRFIVVWYTLEKTIQFINKEFE